MTTASRPDWDGLFARRTSGVRLGLAVVQGVFETLGRPAGTIDAVHLVGTNGKGSTAAMVSHALTGAGRRVGRYTSPHLQRVNERVAIDGTPVSEDVLWAAVQAVDAAERRVPGPRPLSFFEVLTLAAMVVFERAGVDTLVVEAGLGGRLDATRVVSPVVVALTSVALDHQNWLGDDLPSIAAEKVAVFAPGVPVVSAVQHASVTAVVAAAAASVGAPLQVVQPLARAPRGLPGPFQRHNAAVALAVLQTLEPSMTPDALDDVHWPGRVEFRPWGPGALTLDVAHNPAACDALARALGDANPPVDRIIAACQADKDRAGMSQALATLGVPLTWVAVDERTAWTDVAHAVAQGEHVLVCGSHHWVARVRAHLEQPCGDDEASPAAPDPSDPRFSPDTPTPDPTS